MSNNITIGDHSYSADQVIAAIAASNDSSPCTTDGSGVTVQQLYQVLQGFAYRVETLESRLPFTTAGFGVTATPVGNNTNYRVQCLDQQGRTVIVTFEVPN